MTELHYKSATELAQMVRAKEISAVELLQHHLNRIEKIDGDLNAVVVRDFERAKVQALELDNKSTPVGPLHGVPITVKESFNIAGLATTWGAPQSVDQIAARDAVAVAKLKAAGAVVLGKTNVPFMLMDYQALNEIYGVTSNPWDRTRSPGGSSGGSAVALATGMSALEFGSDIGGSIRRPANHCGVYGLKPTLQTICARGHSPFGVHEGWAQPDLAVIGPMARTVEDIALALDLTAGPDELEADGIAINLPPSNKKSLKDFKVAYLPTHDIAPIDQAVVDVMDRAVAALSGAGAVINQGAMPNIDLTQANALFGYLLFSSFTAGMPEEDLVAAKETFDKGALDDHSGTGLIARTAFGYHRQWLDAHRQRARMRELWRDFFEDYDLLLCPISSTAAFPHDFDPNFDGRMLDVNGAPQPFFQQSFWSSIPTLPYLPALTAPCGNTAGGLPVGIQIIGPAFHEKRTLKFADLMAREVGGFEAPPDYS
jgi:amidase